MTTSIRPILADPFEAPEAGEAYPWLLRLEEIAEWFERIAHIEEIGSGERGRPPGGAFTEPVDRRWRARGWIDDDLA